MAKKKVSLESFLSEVRGIESLHPSYRKGGTGKDGTCDCIGLIIGALRRAGGDWPGLHGSNYSARLEMESMAPVRKASDLSVGDLVYKSYPPGFSGYALPDRYKPGGIFYTGDLLDYYHVGVVLSVSPLMILHMTTPRCKRDTTLGKWRYHGRLKRVIYPEKQSAPGKR